MVKSQKLSSGREKEVKHKHNTGLGDRPTHGRQATAKQTREVRSRRASERASSLLGGLRRTDARPARQARHRRSAVRQRAELYQLRDKVLLCAYSVETAATGARPTPIVEETNLSLLKLSLL